MTKKITEHQIIHLAQQCLDQSIQEQDLSLSHRLQKARINALQSRKKPKTVQWISTSVFLVSLVVLVIFFQENQSVALISEEYWVAEEMMQLEENLDLLDNLDFYQWIEESDELA